MTRTIDCGRVDPVDTQLQCAMDRRDRIPILLRTPGKFPASTANGPGAKADPRNVQIGIPKFSRFHCNPRTGERISDGHCRSAEHSFSFFVPNSMNQKQEKLKHAATARSKIRLPI